jgi:23S rRNA (cytosine1962-C5)-methyltransferase
MAKVILTRKANQRVLGGHPWIFSNEVSKIQGNFEQGDIVEVCTSEGNFIGKGYINQQSQIIVRLLTNSKEQAIDENFFYEKINNCWQYRQQIGYTNNCRLVFGEADGLPALVIDKFGEYFVVQTLSLGMDIRKPFIVNALERIFKPKGIYERNDVPVRELEGLQQVKGFLTAPFETEIIIEENGVKFYVDIANGQKTGYFLDQHDNRRAIQHIVKNKEVLGVFTYTGSFEVHAAYYGAKSVTGLDISEAAIEMCKRNAALNNLQYICDFRAVNAFDTLKQWAKDKVQQYDVVMLDPPAFTKSRENIQKAITGYKEINLRGMKLVKPGGFLVTSSCTNLVQPELFLKTIQMAAKDAKRKIRQVTFQAQAQDHPIMWHIENTTYLKFLIVQVL